MSNVLRNLLIKVGVDFTDAKKGFSKLSKELKSVGKSLTKAGESMTKNITLPAVAAVAGLAALTVKSAALSDEIVTLAKEASMSTDQIQELQYASADLDFEVSAVTKGMAKLTKVIGEASKGNKDYIDVADGVQVAIKDANGNLLSQQDIFYATIDAIGSLSNETEKEIAAQKLFGRSFQDLNPLISAGTTELKRLAEEAHTVGAVIEEEDVDALSELNDTIDEMKQVLAASTAQIAKAFAPALMALKPIIESYIVPAIKKFAEWLGGIFEWFGKLSPSTQKFILLIGGLVIAIGPMLTLVGKLITSFGALAKAAAAASAAMASKGLAAAITAFMGPAGIAVAVIAALALIIGSLVIASQKAQAEVKALKEETDALLASVNESTEAYKDQVTNIENQADVNKQLSDELFALAKKENKSNAEKARMKKLVDQLNAAYPDLALSINEVTGELNQESKAVQDIIKRQEQKEKYDAASARYAEILTDERELTDQLTAALEAQVKARAKVVAAEEMAARIHDDTHITVVDEYQAYDTATESVNNLTTAVQANAEEQKALRTEMESSGWAADDYADSVAEAAYTIQDAIEAQSRALADATQLAASDIAAGFQDILSTQDIGMAESLRKMQDYAQKVLAWGKNIASLAGRIPDDIYAALVKAGATQAQLVSDLADATDAELVEWVDAWKSGASSVANAIITIFKSGDFYQASHMAGNNVAFGFANGINDAAGQAYTAAENMASGVTRRLKNVLQIQSPSKVMRGLGRFTTKGFALGLIDKAKEVFENAGSIARGAVSSLSSGGEFAYAGSMASGGSGYSLPEFKGGNVNLSVNLDGREVAKVTAPYMNTELAKKQIATSRGTGV